MRVYGMPFAFEDKRMEVCFRKYYILTCRDRTWPILRIAIPISATMRFFWFIYWYYHYNMMPFVEKLVGIVRIHLLIALLIVYLHKWHSSTLYHLGLALLWIIRSSSIFLILHQFGDTHGDPQVMMELVLVVCFFGLFIPNFSEYLCFALPIPYIKPVSLFLARDKRAHEVAFQHTLILALGLSISAAVHSDSRRDWLRSAPAEEMGREAGAGRAATADRPHDSDAPDDGCYYTAEDRDMILAAQLKAAPHLPFAPTLRLQPRLGHGQPTQERSTRKGPRRRIGEPALSSFGARVSRRLVKDTGVLCRVGSRSIPGRAAGQAKARR